MLNIFKKLFGKNSTEGTNYSFKKMERYFTPESGVLYDIIYNCGVRYDSVIFVNGHDKKYIHIYKSGNTIGCFTKEDLKFKKVDIVKHETEIYKQSLQ